MIGLVSALASFLPMRTIELELVEYAMKVSKLPEICDCSSYGRE
jgi:hypothetical protein